VQEIAKRGVKIGCTSGSGMVPVFAWLETEVSEQIYEISDEVSSRDFTAFSSM